MLKNPPNLTPERRYILLGYYDILDKAPPNGGCNHALKQELTVLRLHVNAGWDIPPEFEARVKQTIRRLYAYTEA